MTSIKGISAQSNLKSMQMAEFLQADVQVLGLPMGRAWPSRLQAPSWWHNQ